MALATRVQVRVMCPDGATLVFRCQWTGFAVCLAICIANQVAWQPGLACGKVWQRPSLTHWPFHSLSLDGDGEQSRQERAKSTSPWQGAF